MKRLTLLFGALRPQRRPFETDEIQPLPETPGRRTLYRLRRGKGRLCSDRRQAGARPRDALRRRPGRGPFEPGRIALQRHAARRRARSPGTPAGPETVRHVRPSRRFPKFCDALPGPRRDRRRLPVELRKQPAGGDRRHFRPRLRRAAAVVADVQTRTGGRRRGEAAVLLLGNHEGTGPALHAREVPRKRRAAGWRITANCSRPTGTRPLARDPQHDAAHRPQPLRTRGIDDCSNAIWKWIRSTPG